MEFYPTVYFIFIFLINIIDGHINHWRCDYSFVKKANGYFKYHAIPANWRDARLRCQLEGAVLASPHPQEVHDALLGLMSHRTKNRTIFTGIHATLSEGDYNTIDGIPMSKIAMEWMESEPDNKDGDENCIILTPKGLAADAKCSNHYTYFCFKEKKDDDMFMDYCGTSDRAYEFSDDTHSCYKFHTVPRTWSRAHMACSAEGGHLLIINSQKEAEFVRKLYGKHPDSMMIGTFRKDMAFVGFQDWNERADWRTIHGDTLKDAGYEVFQSGEPNNQTTGQYCGGVTRSAYFADMWCEEYSPFICEKKPNSLVCDDVECTDVGAQ